MEIITKTNRVSEITHKYQLTAWFEEGCKPYNEWRVGTEHEQFLYDKKTLQRLGYDTSPGIKDVLLELKKDDWLANTIGGKLIKLEKEGTTITLEPGGQFELSGKKLQTVHETFTETQKHFKMLKALGDRLEFYSLPLGFEPLWKQEDMPWILNLRYRYMKDWMPGKGTLGWDMMTRTSSIQVNVDYSSEADMVKKMQVAQAFQPGVMAMFANSPFSEGQPNGYLSYRLHVWEHTDNDRCGWLPFIFDENFGFERWTDFLLDVPMYFIQRDETYLPANGMTFRSFLNGGHELKPTMEDWAVHVSTVFPDVRLKKFIELRGADSGDVNQIVALAAFWTGLLYDQESLDAAHALSKQCDLENIYALRANIPQKGLQAQHGELRLLNIARQLVALAEQGLNRRSLKLGIENEQRYLEPLQEIVQSGRTMAEIHLKNYKELWNGDVRHLITK